MAEAVESRVHELEQSRREINQLNEDLERRVVLRTEELEQKNEELASTLKYLERTQESLIQSEKLASLGSIVAAVAHELNTPIGNALIGHKVGDEVIAETPGGKLKFKVIKIASGI